MEKDRPDGADDFLSCAERAVRELSPDFAHASQQATLFRERFHELLAEAMQIRLVRFASTLPLDTADQKKAAAIGINSDLRKLGLTIRCPRTGYPAALVVDAPDERRSGQGRLRLESRDDRGVLVRTTISQALDDIELMPNPPERGMKDRGKALR